MNISFEQYKKKVKGAFIGKTVGGTLGIPYEGDIRVNQVTYYNPVPTKMLANDDLDLQVLNLEILLHKGLPVSRLNIADIWLKHILDSAPDEYGVAIANHKLGINAPLSGIYRNKFTEGMGGAIRSELWACLAPANPKLAALLAREDATTDHNEDGIYAEMFLAALESQAFVESDIKKLVAVGLECIDKKSKLYNAFSDVIEAYEKTKDVLKVRALVLEKYYSDNWTNVIINLSFILLSLISCEGDFDKAICTAASLGYDADCTCATVGSIMGIIDSDRIDKKWTDPIGDALVLSENIVNAHCDRTIGEFCDTVMCVSYFVQEYYGKVTVEGLTNYKNIKMPQPWTNDYEKVFDWSVGSKESLLAHTPCMMVLKYPEKIAIVPNEKTEYSLKLVNTNTFEIKGKLDFSFPYHFTADKTNSEFSLKAGESVEIPLSVLLKKNVKRTQNNPLLINLEIGGLRFLVEAGLPMSREWQIKDENTGEISYFENTSTFFNVPQGAYTYSIQLNATANKFSRVSCGGTRPFVLKINGEVVYEGNGKFYVPTFHRDNTWTQVKLSQFLNDVEISFPEHGEGEFFIGFSTTFGCSEWLDYMEYYSLNTK